MKKYFLLLFVLFVFPAQAATMCASIPVDNMYSGLIGGIAVESTNAVDWGLFYENGLTIAGVAVCASITDNASLTNRVVDRLVYSSSLDNNYHCYCKVTKPVESAWYLAETLFTTASCMVNCGAKCELVALDNYDFWPSLLPTMKN